MIKISSELEGIQEKMYLCFMEITNIIGQEHIKNQLLLSVEQQRIPHAQIFVGPEGSGTLPMALFYARTLICGNNTSCHVKFDLFTHPDLHFAYPTVTTKDIKTKPKSIDFIHIWREFLKMNPYGGLPLWYQLLDVENKQGLIRVEDALDIQKTFALKSFEGGYKVLIIWMAEKMNMECSNKLLKIIEEPPQKTIILLVVENEKDLLQTILSRCQITRFQKIDKQALVEFIEKEYFLDEASAQVIASRANGNIAKISELLDPDSDEFEFENYFIDWVRMAFVAKKNPFKIIELITWSEKIAKLGREKQKSFLDFCLEFFRQALLMNYNATDIVYFRPFNENFKLENFAEFVNGANISDIYKVISEASYHIERNGNPKLIFSDMSIKLTRLIHKK